MAEKSLVPIGQVDAAGTVWANPNAMMAGGGANAGITGGGVFAQQMPMGVQFPQGQAQMQPQVIYVQGGGGGGGLSDIPWQAIKGGFLTVAGLFQRANQKSLEDDLSDRESEYTTLQGQVDQAFNAYSGNPSQANLRAWMAAQNALNVATRKVNDVQTQLAEENARSSIYTTVGGVGDLAQSFAGGTYPGVGGGGQPQLMAMPQPVAMVQQMQQAAPSVVAYVQNPGGGLTPVLAGFMGGIGGSLLTQAFWPSDSKK